MQALFASRLISPGSLVTVVGALLTVVGSVAYLNDNANLSLPTIFYGIPILLGGLALKSSELPLPFGSPPPRPCGSCGKSLRTCPSAAFSPT